MEEAAMLWLVGDNTGGPICVDDIPFDSEDIFDYFGGLVSIERQYASSGFTWSFLSDKSEERLSIVQLAHFSVKEYLFSPRAGYWALTEEASHLSIIQYSIAYYLHAVAVDDMSPLPRDKLLKKHSLAEYCCRYMSDHLDHLTPRDHPALTSAFHCLLHPDSNYIATRFGTLFFRDNFGLYNYPITISHNHPLALILAARLGLSGVASWLLTFNTVHEQIDVFVPDFECGPPILEAAANGHTDVIRLLLGNGANINQENKYGQNVLFLASENGQETAVRMLIEAGACVNRCGMTPIEAASTEGHQGIVKLLIKAGADVNSGSEPALYCASRGGFEDVVQTLILAGADVNLEGDLGTALHAAAHWHYPGKKIVELLIDAGADTNKLAGKYSTALQAAAAAEHMDESPALEAVQILIRAAANVNLVGGEYGTALQAAAYLIRPTIVEELIDAGADVNLVGGEYGTALRAAASRYSWYDNLEHCISIVQMLIRAGADTNLKGGKDTTPLEEALYYGYPEIARILLDAGAKPPKRPLLSPTYSDSDTGEREGKRPRICDCTEADSECGCTNST
jgi:ankyrin repeat protein